MKKILLGIIAVVVVLIIGAYIFREPLFLAVMRSQIAPPTDFSPQHVPAAPDYTNQAHWAALPQMQDSSDQQPPGASSLSTGVAAFFVHPTSYMSSDNWNQPLDDKDANWLVDQRILRHQASVFNACCEVYAPRYRQATFFSFMEDSDNSASALQLAYADVKQAFQHFIDGLEPDQPYILAGHSQGTRHATKLLREVIAGTPLQRRMVAAYLIGFSITEEDLDGVPVCASPSQTGCAIGWNAQDGTGESPFSSAGNLVCVNPLTWQADNARAPNELNEGGIGYPTYGRPSDDEDHTVMKVEPGAADAQCTDGILVVSDLRSESFPSRMMGNSMHIYDYSLYHMNIRANLLQRVNAFRGAR